MKEKMLWNTARSLGVVALIGVAFNAAYSAEVPHKQAETVPAPITHKPLDEISGAVKSQVYRDVYWIHNDSGDSARVFAVRANGEIVVPPFDAHKYSIGMKEEPGPKEGEKKPFFPGVEIKMAANVDWEDITTDGTNLYLADTGNNGNARRDLGIYMVPEPNPEATTMTTALKRIPVHFPEQSAYPGDSQKGHKWHYDAEAIYWWRKKLYLLTKWRVAGKIRDPEVGSALYRLDSEHTDRSNELTKVAATTQITGWVTGAGVSPDSNRVAVLCGSPEPAVFVYPAAEVLQTTPIRISFSPGADKVESIAWIDNQNLMLISETGKRWTLAVPTKPA